MEIENDCNSSAHLIIMISHNSILIIICKMIKIDNDLVAILDLGIFFIFDIKLANLYSF